MVQSIKSSNLKIVLTPDEVFSLFGESTINIRSERTGRVMDKILVHAAKKLDFEPFRNKLVVEIFEKPNGECVIFFIGVCQGKREVVLEFNSIDDLISVAKELKNVDFSGYLYKGNYRIVAKITPKSEKTIKRMCEFSKIDFRSEEIARTKEYGTREF